MQFELLRQIIYLFYYLTANVEIYFLIFFFANRNITFNYEKLEHLVWSSRYSASYIDSGNYSTTQESTSMHKSITKPETRF